jgi:NADH dehydrogenase FAD-containing subunit
VNSESDLETLKGYFRVNDFLQSTSHGNVFGGGDCITMETYIGQNFPPKAGVYAVRAGPFMARNIISYVEEGRELETYVPQRGFLALLMTADGKAIGTKFGIAFTGKWVWKMKDYIDTNFMKLFDPYYLFKDFETQ